MSARPPNTDIVVMMGLSSLGIFAGITFTGIGSTWWLVDETKDKSLEQLSREKQQGFISG